MAGVYFILDYGFGLMERSEGKKTALVTGASKGIGAAIAIDLAGNGFDVWVNYRSDHDSAKKVSEQIEDLGRKCTLLPFDVTDNDAVQQVLGKA